MMRFRAGSRLKNVVGFRASIALRYHMWYFNEWLIDRDSDHSESPGDSRRLFRGYVAVVSFSRRRRIDEY